MDQLPYQTNFFVNSGEEILSIDCFDSFYIAGWYKNLDGESRKISLIFGNEQQVDLEASNMRFDVANAGYGEPECGFDCHFNPPLPPSTSVVVVGERGKVLLSALVHPDGILVQSHQPAIIGDPSSLFQSQPSSISAVSALTIADDAVLMFDISDLVYYIGHHDNLTGIQRVQSCVLLALLNSEIYPRKKLAFLSYNNRRSYFVIIPVDFIRHLLNDLMIPSEERRIAFSKEDAKVGVLPQSVPLVQKLGTLGQRTVLCLLGAAWVNRDYFRRVLDLKRSTGMRFAMTVHDLIPIYARETCDQGTASVFTSFFKRALRHTDTFLSVSQNTARDLQRYAEELGLSAPQVTVTQNGSSFDEFIIAEATMPPVLANRLHRPFVLFVSTIEGRKNHLFVFRLWQELIKSGVDVPDLVCVGRLGWRADVFLTKLAETNNLDRRIHILKDVSDQELDWLYKNCRFTVYPSLYEGWGLPVGESLAKGKVCVTSSTSSLPEVGGDCAVYVDPNNVGTAVAVLSKLITSPNYLQELEQRVVREYRPVTWREVAERVVRASLETLCVAPKPIFPTIVYGQEYCFALSPDSLPDRLGEEMMAQILAARRGQLRSAHLTDEAFLTAEDMRAGNAWFEPEVWGTWSSYPKSELSFLLPPDALDGVQAYLYFQIPAALVGSAFQIESDGELLFAGTLQKMNGVLTFPLRPRIDGAGNTLPVNLEFSCLEDAQRMAALKEIDKRGLGLGFRRMVFLRCDDIVGRLEVVENLLIASV